MNYFCSCVNSVVTVFNCMLLIGGCKVNAWLVKFSENFHTNDNRLSGNIAKLKSLANKKSSHIGKRVLIYSMDPLSQKAERLSPAAFIIEQTAPSFDKLSRLFSYN